MIKIQNRAKESKERILNISLLLFANQGYDKTSIREIAKKANVNLSAIKYYFGDKESLYKEVYHKFVGPSGEERDNYIVCDTLDKQIEQMFNIMFESLKDINFQLGIKLHMREQLDPIGLWKNDIENDIKPKHFNTFKLIKKEIPNISDESAHRLIFSIVSLFLGILVNQDVIKSIDSHLLSMEKITDWKEQLIKYAKDMINQEKNKWRIL